MGKIIQLTSIYNLFMYFSPNALKSPPENGNLRSFWDLENTESSGGIFCWRRSTRWLKKDGAVQMVQIYIYIQLELHTTDYMICDCNTF